MDTRPPAQPLDRWEKTQALLACVDPYLDSGPGEPRALTPSWPYRQCCQTLDCRFFLSNSQPWLTLACALNPALLDGNTCEATRALEEASCSAAPLPWSNGHWHVGHQEVPGAPHTSWSARLKRMDPSPHPHADPTPHIPSTQQTTQRPPSPRFVSAYLFNKETQLITK